MRSNLIGCLLLGAVASSASAQSNEPLQSEEPVAAAATRTLTAFDQTLEFKVPNGLELVGEKYEESKTELKFAPPGEEDARPLSREVVVRVHNMAEKRSLSGLPLLEFAIGLSSSICPESFYVSEIEEAVVSGNKAHRAIYGCTGSTLFNDPQKDKRFHFINVLQVFEIEDLSYEIWYKYRLESEVETEKNDYYRAQLDQLKFGEANVVPKN